jgi:polyphosphate glucokinase
MAATPPSTPPARPRVERPATPDAAPPDDVETPATAAGRAPPAAAAEPVRPGAPGAGTPRKAAARRRPRAAPTPANTLSIDIGGTGIKASVLDPTGQLEHDRVRIPTPYPLSPLKLLTVLEDLTKSLPPFERVSAGFPGMVRDGHILSAPHFVSPDGPSGEPAPKLVKAWARFDLESELARVTGKPTKVANDADLQGSAVIRGKGFEAVLTLGTGLGSAFFKDGLLLPHFELSHHPFRKGLAYNDWIGEAARRSIGHKKWQRRVLDAIDTIRNLTYFDHCFLGGGNSSRIDVALPDDVTIVDNSAGILGGIKLWERIG